MQSLRIVDGAFAPESVRQIRAEVDAIVLPEGVLAGAKLAADSAAEHHEKFFIAVRKGDLVIALRRAFSGVRDADDGRFVSPAEPGDDRHDSLRSMVFCQVDIDIRQ